METGITAYEKPSEITIRGILSPYEWDDRDQVTGLLIATSDEEEYHVLPQGSLETLLVLVESFVEARGRVRDQRGKQFISITSIAEVAPPTEISGWDANDEWQ